MIAATSVSVAIIAVAGVGDDPPGAAAQRTVDGLLRHSPERFQSAEETLEWFPQPARFGVPQAPSQPVRRFRLKGEGRPDVDVYEMWWADLSRFPAALRASTVAMFSLLLQAPILGRASAGGGGPVQAEPTVSPLRPHGVTGWTTAALGVIEWILAVPLMFIGLLLLSLIGGEAIAFWMHSSPALLVHLVLGLYGAALSAAGLTWVFGRYRDGRWGAEWVALGALLLTAASVVTYVIEDRGSDIRALADTGVTLAAYPFRMLWLLTGVVMLAVLAGCAILGLRSTGDARERVTTVLLTMVGPLGVALLTALVAAATLAPFRTSLNHVTEWPDRGHLPLCLPTSDSWSLTRTGCRTDAYAWATNLFAQCLVPLVIVGALVLALVLGLAAYALVRTLLLPATRDLPLSGRLWTAIVEILEWINGSVSAMVVFAGMVLASCGALATWLAAGPLTVHASDESSAGTLTASVMGVAIAGVFALSRLIGLRAPGLVGRGMVSESFRRGVDRAYDVVSYLREPTPSRSGDARQKLVRGVCLPRQLMPRQRIMARFAALMEYVTHGGRPHSEAPQYQRVVFFAHSQGTVLTTGLLADPNVSLPPAVDLLTFGCPLRQLYARRFPRQFHWVTELGTSPREYVTRVTGTWINAGADQDFVGRWLFNPPPPEHDPGHVYSSGGPGHPVCGDLFTGPGGHDSYWSSPEVFRELTGRL